MTSDGPLNGQDGAASSVAGRRRVAVIAFADVVGYSTLMAADEPGIYSRWMALLSDLIEPQTARHGGRIVDMAGDGLLAEFPDLISALLWARTIQHGIRLAIEDPSAVDPLPIVLRIGVHTGEVFETGPRLFGDAVNFAARLQSHAAPGGIVISERVRQAMGDALKPAELRELGPVELKGFERCARLFTIDCDVVRVAVPAHPSGGLPSFAVLPLLDEDQGPATSSFADGFAEDVAMSLARLHELFVVSAASSAMFRGRLPDPREVGRALGVRYVLMGRMRRVPGGYGVSVQLCDTRTGETLWAERIRVDPREVFDMQDDIVRRIVAGLAPHVRAAELQRAMRKAPDSQTAYDRTLRALYMMSSTDRDTFDCARRFLAEAMIEEPGFALPIAWAARWHSVRIGRGWSADPDRDGAEAFVLAKRAVEIDRTNALAYATLGHLNTILRRDSDAAMMCFEAALDASPNHALAWTLSSATLAYLGQGDEAVRRAELGLRLSPQDPMRYSQFMFLGIAHYAKGNFAEAVRWQRRSAIDNPLHAATLLLLAAALAGDGKSDEARHVGVRFLALRPDFSLAAYGRSRLPFFKQNLRDAFAAHLRHSGLPE
ncbi:adenylate/guanylate cyclase domain-containing protein [Falsiroseomonas sp. E2-1-a20]|uniref:adenylate/guanylate cyclase domain-containing protein n=1 Tax=Falsiroseomonas sp. E2-1-a20 TaxID=3239300 RepID=UPI003F2EEC46